MAADRSASARSTPATTWRPDPPAFDVDRVRHDFPILKRRVHGKPLVYLDNAATSQKPGVVLDAMTRFYSEDCANIHRGVHALGERATRAYEDARAAVRRFVNARADREIIFTRGTTESINLVAHSYGRSQLQPGDEVILSLMEHHSNIVPWQLVCAERDAVLRVVPVTDDGELSIDAYERLLGPRTKLVALTHVSNVLGTINPLRRIIELAHAHDVPVVVDGAQAAAHLAIDVQALGCDFYAFSGHKLYGPLGIGVLYGRAEHLDAMPPYQAGGNMIGAVSFEGTTYAAPPYRFEAGTPNIVGAVGLAAALDYVETVGIERIAAHEQELLAYATEALADLGRVRVIGTAQPKVGLLSFVVDGVHPHDVATVLDRDGIAVRAGHHCAQPLMKRFARQGTTRAALACYTTRADIDALVAGLHTVLRVLA